MHYEITQDCRIGNTDYKAGQIVTKEEVGGLFFHVMTEADEATQGKNKADPKTPSKETKEPETSEEEEDGMEVEDEADEAPKGKKK